MSEMSLLVFTGAALILPLLLIAVLHRLFGSQIKGRTRRAIIISSRGHFATIAYRSGMSPAELDQLEQRAQAFVTREEEGPHQEGGIAVPVQ
jgi:Kef-type K+ transport system membrane component KefB